MEVHEALHRSGTNAAAVAKDVQVAEDVKRRVELVIEAKEVGFQFAKCAIGSSLNSYYFHIYNPYSLPNTC